MPPSAYPRHSRTAEPQPGRKSWPLQKACAGFKGERARIYEMFLQQTSRSILDAWHGEETTRSDIVEQRSLNAYCFDA